MRKVLAVIALTVALASAPQALAKGPGAIQICGAWQCAMVGDATQPRVRVFSGPLDASVAPAAPSPFYVLRFADVGGTIGYWIPNVGLLRLGQLTSRWVSARHDETVALALATAGIAPHPAPRGQAATAVDSRPARGGRTYLRLYTIGTPTPAAPDAGGWLRVFVVGAMTPWTDGANSLWVSKRGGFIRRDGTIARISANLASRIRLGLPLS